MMVIVYLEGFIKVSRRLFLLIIRVLGFMWAFWYIILVVGSTGVGG